MKKILLYAVLIIAVVFYIAQTSFAEIGSFNTDGNLFSDRQIRSYSYADLSKPTDSVAIVK